MEPIPPASNPKSGKHAQLPCSTGASGTTQHTHVQEQSVTENTQFSTHRYEHHPNLCHALENKNAHSTTDLDHENKAAFTGLTTQALHEHDRTYAIHSILPNFLNVSGEENATSLQVEDTGTLSNMTLLDNRFQSLVDSRHQTQSHGQSSASMYDEAGLDTAVCQGTCRWLRSPHSKNIMGTPERRACRSECFCWNTDQSRELTAWGDELAGVGEHLAAYDHQGDTSYGDLVVDESLAD